MKTRNVRFQQWRRYDRKRLNWCLRSASYKPNSMRMPPSQIRFMIRWAEQHGRRYQ